MNLFTKEYFLTAGECDAIGKMPLPLLVARLIECATCHANALGIGYAKLIELDLAWVLSRVSVEIDSLPGINETYIIDTWIESTNRLFSERCFKLYSPDGHVYAQARTTWASISISTRKAANPGILGDVMFPTEHPDCSVIPAKRTPIIPDGADELTYAFRYCDIDFNRHVNTVRYVDLILDCWPLDWYDNHNIARFDVAFHQECHFGDEVILRTTTDANLQTYCEIDKNTVRMVSSNILWKIIK